VADGQDVNAEGVNAYKRVPLYANHIVGVSWSLSLRLSGEDLVT
jgi:hypothetical protein